MINPDVNEFSINFAKSLSKGMLGGYVREQNKHFLDGRVMAGSTGTRVRGKVPGLKACVCMFSMARVHV